MEESQGETKKPSNLSQEEQFERVQEICQPFLLENDKLVAVKHLFLSELKKGMEEDGVSTITCHYTFINEFPTGCEYGMFLVIEFGGSFFRISCVHLKGARKYDINKQVYDIATELYSGDIETLLDHIVDCLYKFLWEHDLLREPLNLVVCLGFSMRHAAVNSAMIVDFSKNIKIPGLLHKDIVELVQSAIDRRKGLRVKVKAAINTCAAILLGCDRSGIFCHIGINMGTSFNAVYAHDGKGTNFEDPEDSSKHILLNVEWKEFGKTGELDTVYNEFDQLLDAATVNKGSQKFVKMTSGFYLGELSRLIIVHCINEGILFGGYISKSLKQPFGFLERYVSGMLAEEENEYDHMRLLFDKLGIGRPDVKECIKVKYILNAVVKRSAALVATGIASLMEIVNKPHINIAIGGKFFFESRIYSDILAKKLKELLGNSRTFELKSDVEAVSVGPAILAAILTRKDFLYESIETKKLFEEVITVGK